MKTRKICFLGICLLIALLSCSKSKTKVPTACFTITQTGIGKTNALVNLINCSTDAEHYLWNFGNGETSTDVSPKNVVHTTGTYTIKLLAYSGDGEKSGIATMTLIVLADSVANTSSLQQLANDENTMDSNSDDAMNDVNAVLSPGGLSSLEMLPCNATIDSTPANNDTTTLYITYNGLSCDAKKFNTGTIEIKKSINTRWNDAGAKVLVKFIDFKVRRVATLKSMTFNGTKTFMNVSGGFIWQLGYQIQALTQKVTGTIQVTFDDNTTKTWNISKQRTFTRIIDSTHLSHLLLTKDGFGSADGYGNLLIWGVNRTNENFYVQIAQSIILKEACDWDQSCGVETFRIPSNHTFATVTFGYDDNNNQIPCTSNECPTRYRIDWSINNQSGTFFLPIY